MKNILQLIALCSTISIATANAQWDSQESVRGHHKPNPCCPEVRKEKCKRKKITKVPYTVKHSGVYSFCANLELHPTADGVNAITIKEGVSDVVIDFAGYTLSMDATSKKADNNGVFINATCENIVIKNGTIHGFSASQIRGLDRLNTIEVSDMVLRGIDQDHGGQRMVNQSFTSGVNFGPAVEEVGFEPDPSIVSNNITLQNLTINNIYLENLDIADQFAWGVALFSCNNVHMDHVNVSGITNNGLVQAALGSAYAFGLNLCSNCISNYCTGNDVTCLAPNFNNVVVGDGQAMVYLGCNRIETYDSSFNNCIGTRRGGGLTWVACTNFVAERCTADSNRVVNPLVPGVQSRYGFEAVGSIIGLPPCQRGVLKDCHVLNMPLGFTSIGSIDIIFENCEAIGGNIPTEGFSSIYGFLSNGSESVTFKNCIATDYYLAGVNASGFRATFSDDINILNCKSSFNSIGIRVESSSTNVIADSNEVAFNAIFGLVDFTPVQTPNLYTRNVAFANGTNYSVNTANPNFAVVQANQGAGFPLYTAPNASPLSNFDLQP